MPTETRVWFFSDIHGSEVCFRKFVNAATSSLNPNVLILGGDITGKYVVPIVSLPDHTHVLKFQGATELLEREDIPEVIRRLSDKGVYPYECDSEQFAMFAYDSALRDRITSQLRAERLSRWVALADERFRGTNYKVLVNLGNDDPPELEAVLDQSNSIIRPEGRVVEIGQELTVASVGYSNKTPWDTPRELTEEGLRQKIAEVVAQVSRKSNCIFNFHCPPKNTRLDRAPKLDAQLRPVMTPAGQSWEHVGSQAVREAIERFQPAAGLHGHIHEQHCCERIGNTLCCNPGSSYALGTLQGVFLSFRDGKLAYHHLTREEIQSSDMADVQAARLGAWRAFPFIGQVLYEIAKARNESSRKGPGSSSQRSLNAGSIEDPDAGPRLPKSLFDPKPPTSGSAT